ncbi:IS3 family transposase [Thiomicrospira sp. R3]|uniref:IS3 family transposase n=1 Tax=Thiomicrospira sp. R3 TaxID=3035472 RepID=UPI00259B6DBF|nr:IS3 family transposase [Thiomicrospira sp. R3]WFE68518.1 IS3 family transposase [Thiomicrospira sp. R3]
MKYAWIQKHREEFLFALMCKVLKVPVSSFNSWLKLDQTDKASEQKNNADLIKEVFATLKGNAGARGIKGYLADEKNVTMSRRKIAIIMRKQGLIVHTRKKFKKANSAAINDPKIKPNLLNRAFKVSYLNQVWVGDITQIKTQQGWMYLATYIDLYSRKVVGWALETHMRSELIETALKRALWNRKPPKGLMVHTDQGSQFISHAYRKLMAHWGIKQSMSRRGNCWDNAVIESFFKSFKTETVYQLKKLIDQQEMRWLVSEYMGHYNHIRPHSSNGYIPPAKFERMRLDRLKAIEENLGTKKC